MCVYRCSTSFIVVYAISALEKFSNKRRTCSLNYCFSVQLVVRTAVRVTDSVLWRKVHTFAFVFKDGLVRTAVYH